VNFLDIFEEIVIITENTWNCSSTILFSSTET